MAADHEPRTWFKSSCSGANNPSCVESRFTGGGIDLRDSKAPAYGVLSFS